MWMPFLAGFLALMAAPAAGAHAVTEEEFLAPFSGEHEAITALTAGIARAEAARERAGLLPNPRIDFWREDPETGPRLTNWTVAWTPPLDGRYGLGKRAAEAGLTAEHERLAIDRAALRHEVRQSFARWSLACERRDVLAASFELVEGLSEQEEARARAGEVSGLSSRRLKLAAEEVRAALATTEAESLAAEAEARAWRPDLPAGVRPSSVQLIEPPAELPTGGSPRIRALEEDLVRAGLEARRADRFWGSPTLQVGWQTLEGSGNDEGGPILAAGWDIPLFDRDQDARLQTRRGEQIATARLQISRSRVAGEARGALESYRVHLASARGASVAAREAGAVIDASISAYRAGETGLTDLLEALHAAFAARLREFDIRADALEAHRLLEAVVGVSLSEGETR